MARVNDASGLAAARALAAASIAACLALAACDETPAPSAANTQPPPRGPSQLMGAPEAAPPPAAEPPPAYAPPAPPAAAQVTMAPIPNPGDPGSEAYYSAPTHRVHGRYAVAEATPGAAGRVSQTTPSRAPPKYGAPIGASRGPSVVVSHAAKETHPAPKPTKSAAARPSVRHAAAQATASAAAVPAAQDGVAGLASLQSVLTGALAQGAVLSTPDQFVANQPADVTLTIPSTFGDTLHASAQSDGLADAAASVSLTADLSGSGYTVIPQEAQTIPMVGGKPTEFHWTVTAQPNAKGPLHADVSTTLLGGGAKTLTLGAVQKPVGGMKLTPRIVGASLLFLIGGLIVAWLARGRGPSQSFAARRAARRAARSGRPLNMGGDPPPPV